MLFTGLSGSGKSTLARAVQVFLLQYTERTVTLLDDDIVRRMLSSELGFSRAHRDMNVQRIGYVAAESAAMVGLRCVCAIAPYAATRAAV